jgi:phage repressor protein C with HTH and peptisase S24 domain
VRSEDRTNSRLFRLLSRSLLREGMAVRFRAHGRSMFPAIADGDLVEVHPHQSHAIGDVVLLDGDDGIRAHRVISATNHQIVTRGDSCREADASNTIDSVIGRVARVITKGGQRTPHTIRTRLRQFLSSLR